MAIDLLIERVEGPIHGGAVNCTNAFCDMISNNVVSLCTLYL